MHVEYPLGARLLRRMPPGAVSLNPAVAWPLDVHDGAAHLDADLRGDAMQAVSFHSGVAHSRLMLGAANVALDNRWFGAVGNGLTVQSASYDEAADRYRMIISGGVDRLTVTDTARRS
ncbi:MAG: hypothetical protein QOG46_1313 [Pseudonocardiales bacterium]|nr:hypothetical protein [Pseudonocardiales bacterium]